VANIRFEIIMPSEMRDRIDEWRRCQADLPPRAEAIRRLLDIALQVPRKPDRDASAIVAEALNAYLGDGAPKRGR
jgi:hypothetical protein